jgi:hypothetical protein
MCSSTSHSLMNHNGPGSAASSTISSIVKPEGGAAGKTKCIECDGYEYVLNFFYLDSKILSNSKPNILGAAAFRFLVRLCEGVGGGEGVSN